MKFTVTKRIQIYNRVLWMPRGGLLGTQKLTPYARARAGLFGGIYDIGKKLPKNGVKKANPSERHSCAHYERGQNPEKGESGEKFMIILIPMLVF